VRRAAAALAVALLAACASAEKKEPEDAGPPPLPVALTGNDEISERDLLYAARRELDAFQKKGHRPADLADAGYAMELALRREGFAHARVAFRMEPSEEAPESVTFEIREGPLVRIAALSFPGARAIGRDKLMRFFPGGEEPVFRQSDVDGGAGEIERAYLLAGYRDVEVATPVVEWNEDRSRATVTIAVDQGEPYRIVAATFEGDVPDSLREKLTADLVGEAYYARLPAEAAARLRSYLLDLGYQQAQVAGDAKLEGTAVTIHIRAERGPQYALRELVIEGNDRTRARFIRSRLALHEGDVLEQNKIDEAVDNLYESGVFRTVRVNPGPFSPEASEADLKVEVEELAARSVAFDVGWGSYELLRGGVRYRDRNFLGLGRRLALGAHASTKGYELDGAISDNYLLGRRNTLRLAGRIFEREEPSFTRFGYKIDLSLTHEMQGPYVLNFGYSIESQEASDIRTDEAVEDEGQFIRSAGLFAGLVRDTRNNRLLPKRGSVGEIGVFWSTNVLGADLNYLGLRASWFSFFPLGDRFVLGTGFRFQSRPILDDEPTLPIQKRLFLGGATSVRSFRQSRLGPYDPTNREPIGGLTSLSAHIELRARVWRELHLATFYEGGPGIRGAGRWWLAGPARGGKAMVQATARAHLRQRGDSRGGHRAARTDLGALSDAGTLPDGADVGSAGRRWRSRGRPVARRGLPRAVDRPLRKRAGVGCRLCAQRDRRQLSVRVRSWPAGTHRGRETPALCRDDARQAVADADRTVTIPCYAATSRW